MRFIFEWCGIVILGYSLGGAYSWLTPKIGISALFACHVFISCCFLALSSDLRRLLSLQKLTKQSLYPAIFLTSAASLLAIVTAFIAPHGKPSFPAWDWHFLLFILGIPLVEEILYRGALYLGLRRQNSVLWFAGYGSALVFALAHTSPSLAPFKLAPPPIGVFLLGGICVYLTYRTGALWAAIFFHAAGNLTVQVFEILDPRWLDWLSWLYLTV